VIEPARRRAAAALGASALLVVLASACAEERPPSPAAPTPSPRGSAAADAVDEVARRLARLKAELAITPHFCSLENRPCRTAKRAVIERSVAALLERCGGRPRRQFDRCLQSEVAAVLAAQDAGGGAGAIPR
jgi:hypothetical protein